MKLYTVCCASSPFHPLAYLGRVLELERRMQQAREGTGRTDTANAGGVMGERGGGDTDLSADDTAMIEAMLADIRVLDARDSDKQI